MVTYMTLGLTVVPLVLAILFLAFWIRGLHNAIDKVLEEVSDDMNDLLAKQQALAASFVAALNVLGEENDDSDTYH